MSLRDGNIISEEAAVDGLFNYLMDQEIGRSSTSVVFRATCKRGRLRNRQVAIKKISSGSIPGDHAPPAKDVVAATALHSSLCHPSIVSLVSSFISPCGFYQVMEICEYGSLAQLLSSRNPSILVEDELRGVAKALIDALIYLKKERVLHRDIKPSNILLASNSRVKLSGFSSAIRLPTIDSLETAFCGSPNYISPEILAGQPYSFGIDAWSLGCVFVTCLSGNAAFHASTPDNVFDNICRAAYTLPDMVSYEVRDLISGLLQKSPQDRTPLHRIPTHPFFKPSLPVKPLSPARIITNETCRDRPTSAQPFRRYPSSLSANPVCPHPTTSKHSSAFKHETMLKRAPLEDITNVYQDLSLDDMDILQVPPRAASAPTILSLRRFGTAGNLGDTDTIDNRPPTPALTADSGTPSTTSIVTSQVRRATVALLSTKQGSGQYPPAAIAISPRARLKRVLSDPCGSDLPSVTALPSSVRPVLRSRCLESLEQRVSSKATSSTAVSRFPTGPSRQPSGPILVSEKQQIPVGLLTASRKFSTRRLKPQTQKVSRGQLVVLPSKSLLVDFREGERRKGRRGKEVLVISPDGHTIEIYDAPHLSTPCCLAEPVTTYTVEQLPSKYMKVYEDAVSLVDQLNSRIPQLIQYCDDAKCMLMANGPPGDVEIYMPTDHDATISEEQVAIRLRVSRGRHTLEISRYIAKRKEIGEWVKKVFPLTASLELAEEDWFALDGLERLCMARLSDFLRICEATEVIEGDGGTPKADKAGRDGRERLERALRQIETQSKDTVLDEGPGTGQRTMFRATSVASSMSVPPRPRGFSSTNMLR